ncbi:MAG: carboxylesterase/lipase family protein [Chloroflexota bacterium]
MENTGTTPGKLIVETRYGDLEGIIDRGTRAWLGIPYAQPPTGELRGRAPRPPLPWNGLRSASRFGSSAVQISFAGDPSAPLHGSEDCLYLNVWTPPHESAEPRAVLVYIHGGAFVVGSGSEPYFNGPFYPMRGNLVYVTLNYRLGGFGFLPNDRDPAASNLGLLDQIAALQWIRDNITAFGGDPNNVTVMGESAGGMSIGCILGVPQAEGLFHRAIVQSGGARPVFSRDEAALVLERVLRAANVQHSEQLLALPANELNAVFGRVAASSNDALVAGEPFHPAVDGVVIPTHPLENLRPLPTLVGYCENEIAFFKEIGSTALLEGLPARVRRIAGEETWRLLEQTYMTTERRDRSWHDDLVNDALFGVPSLRLANGITAAGAGVWAYRFDYPGASPVGAGHTTDLAFTFNTPEHSLLPPDWTENAQALAARMQDAFISFSRSGDPNTSSLPHWPRYTPDDPAFMSFDVPRRVSSDFIGAERRAAWEPVPLTAI